MFKRFYTSSLCLPSPAEMRALPLVLVPPPLVGESPGAGIAVEGRQTQVLELDVAEEGVSTEEGLVL